MNDAIIPELSFFASALLIGFCLAFFYDILRIFRRLLKHSLFFVSLEDFLFWIVVGVAGFSMIYKWNYGIIRWYAILGMVLSALFYYGVCSHFVILFGTKFFEILLKPIKKGLKKIAYIGKIIKIKRANKKSRKDKKYGKEK